METKILIKPTTIVFLNLFIFVRKEKRNKNKTQIRKMRRGKKYTYNIIYKIKKNVWKKTRLNIKIVEKVLCGGQCGGSAGTEWANRV